MEQKHDRLSCWFSEKHPVLLSGGAELAWLSLPPSRGENNAGGGEMWNSAYILKAEPTRLQNVQYTWPYNMWGFAGHAVSIATTQLSSWSINMDSACWWHNCDPTKLYLQKPKADRIWPVGCVLPAPRLDIGGQRKKRVKSDLKMLVLNHGRDSCH